jgi:hypothetical protein
MRHMGLLDAEVHSIEQAICPDKRGNSFSETLKSIALKANIQISRPKNNIRTLMESLYCAQSKLEGAVWNRKQLQKARNKINCSIWHKYLSLIGKI